ncbi:MAG: ABC transporter ATP-binding protein [Eubacterium sp.]|nr:ABC transporter ATP-binding protein [Eubacterium sp.]
MERTSILEIRDLYTYIKTDGERKPIVKGVNIELKPGEIHGIVGESGSGKTFTAKSILRLHDETQVDYEGSVIYEDVNLLELTEREMYIYREKEISYVFQNPMNSFDSLFTIGSQIEETLRYTAGLDKKEAKKKTLELLESVGVTPAKEKADKYPHEFSGGMLQRSMIALALACNPKVVIADEATTALDVTMQAKILKLFKHIRDENNISILCITHDLGVVAEICDTVTVMYHGEVVEIGSVRDIFDRPQHEYTKRLLQSFKEVS